MAFFAARVSDTRKFCNQLKRAIGIPQRASSMLSGSTAYAQLRPGPYPAQRSLVKMSSFQKRMT